MMQGTRAETRKRPPNPNRPIKMEWETHTFLFHVLCYLFQFPFQIHFCWELILVRRVAVFQFLIRIPVTYFVSLP